MRTVTAAGQSFNIDVTHDEFRESIKNLEPMERYWICRDRWEMLGKPNWRVGHHIWCNFIRTRPASECRMCKGLNKNYPQNGSSEDELMAKHFPNNKKV